MSKATELLSMIEATNKDVVDRAMKWWNGLPPEKQKEFLNKVPAEKVSKVYQDIYGTSAVAAAASEDMSKMKKILTAAAIVAFLGAGSAQAGQPTQADYDKYDRLHSKQTTQQTQPDIKDVGKRAADVTKRAIDLYGNPHTQQRANKVSQDVEFIQSVLDTLSGE